MVVWGLNGGLLKVEVPQITLAPSE